MERQSLMFPLLPPIYPMKMKERAVFQAEQAFLSVLPRMLQPELTHVSDQQAYLHSLLTDIASTQIANEVVKGYGLNGEQPVSDKSQEKIQDKSYHTINTDRRIAIQTLWILHKDCFSPEAFPYYSSLEEKYGLSERNNNIFKRAQSNIGYYQDRLYIRESPEKEQIILEYIEGMYGKQTRDGFAQFYRLAEYANTQSFERKGAYPECRGAADILRLADLLEVGHAVTEHISGDSHGGRYPLN